MGLGSIYRQYLKRFFVGFLCFLLGSFAYAQQKFEYGPIPKEGVKLIYQKIKVEDVVPGRSGENITWDFTTVTKRDAIVVKNYIAPDSLARAEFPEANFMEVHGDSIFRALKTEYGRTYSLGYFDKPADLKISYPDPLLLSRFPVSYLDVVIRNYTTNFSMKDESFKGEGQVKIEADGYGRLRLPNKIYNEVMRIRISKKQTDKIEEYEVSQETSTVTYIWLSKKHQYPVFVLQKSTSGNEMYKDVLLLRKVVRHNDRYRNQHIRN